MERIATAIKTKEIIRKHDFMVKKNYGQNFLVDAHVFNKIINHSDITKDDLIIEIGPGLGGLTQILAESAGKVIAIEIDKRLIPILGETLADCDNAEVINGDALKVDYAEIIAQSGYASAKVVANLPYYITTPIIMSLVSQGLPITDVVVMVQKEVAARMTAKPRTKDYGSLSIAINYYCEPYLVANVPSNSFIPRPGVDSAVISLKVYKSPPVVVENEALLFMLIKCAFSMRRKTLLNCIFSCNDLNFSKEDIKTILANCNFDEHVRGETLSLDDYVTLTKQIDIAKN